MEDEGKAKGGIEEEEEEKMEVRERRARRE